MDQLSTKLAALKNLLRENIDIKKRMIIELETEVDNEIRAWKQNLDNEKLIIDLEARIVETSKMVERLRAIINEGPKSY